MSHHIDQILYITGGPHNLAAIEAAIQEWQKLETANLDDSLVNFTFTPRQKGQNGLMLPTPNERPYELRVCPFCAIPIGIGDGRLYILGRAFITPGNVIRIDDGSVITHLAQLEILYDLGSHNGYIKSVINDVYDSPHSGITFSDPWLDLDLYRSLVIPYVLRTPCAPTEDKDTPAEDTSSATTADTEDNTDDNVEPDDADVQDYPQD